VSIARDPEREAAIEFGRRLGADETARRGEKGEERERRAAAYAAWRYDLERDQAKDWAEYCDDFGIKPTGGLKKKV
jgi:hypothetical protein